MSEEEPGDYRIVFENGTESKSSRDFTGKATAYYDNIDSYDGHFLQGLRSGYGKYIYNTGEIYEGDFKDNLKHGFGKLIYPEKGVYHGYFESGKRHGEGVFTYPTGDSYNGWWKDGFKDGKGTYIYKANDIKVKGNWLNGKILRGQWILPNGVYYHSFCLYPEETQPSGTVNLTVIKGKQYRFQFNDKFISEINNFVLNLNNSSTNINRNTNFILRFISKSYDLFVINKGSANLLFT